MTVGAQLEHGRNFEVDLDEEDRDYSFFPSSFPFFEFFS